jgi:hypothetical protein
MSRKALLHILPEKQRHLRPEWTAAMLNCDAWICLLCSSDDPLSRFLISLSFSTQTSFDCVFGVLISPNNVTGFHQQTVISKFVSRRMIGRAVAPLSQSQT